MYVKYNALLCDVIPCRGYDPELFKAIMGRGLHSNSHNGFIVLHAFTHTMKHQVILHAKSGFHASFIQKQLQIHGESVKTGTGEYYRFTGSGWISGGKVEGKSVLEPSEVKSFLTKHGNKQPVHIPDSVWAEMDAHINGRERVLSIGEYLGRLGYE